MGVLLHALLHLFEMRLYYTLKKKSWSREGGFVLVLKTCGFQMMQLNALFLVLISVTIPMALRASFGPLPFSVAFVATEAFKVIINLNQIKMINFLSR